MRVLRWIGTAVLALASAAALAQPAVAPDVPTVTVTASANAQVRNDRAHAWLRADAEAPDAAAAARQVNAATGRALARIKTVAAVTATTSGYSTQPIVEKGKTVRWRVSQSLALESSDFEALAGLVTRLQSDDGLLLSGLSFSLSRTARERVERDLVREAVQTWQARANEAASALGFATARPWRVNVQAGEAVRPYPAMRVSAMQAEAPPPVSLEGGFADVTVTVSGEARLETAAVPAR